MSRETSDACEDVMIPGNPARVLRCVTTVSEGVA